MDIVPGGMARLPGCQWVYVLNVHKDGKVDLLWVEDGRLELKTTSVSYLVARRMEP